MVEQAWLHPPAPFAHRWNRPPAHPTDLAEVPGPQDAPDLGRRLRRRRPITADRRRTRPGLPSADTGSTAKARRRHVYAVHQGPCDESKTKHDEEQGRNRHFTWHGVRTSLRSSDAAALPSREQCSGSFEKTMQMIDRELGRDRASPPGLLTGYSAAEAKHQHVDQGVP